MRKRGYDRTNQLEDKGEVVKREKTLKKRREVSPTQLELTKIHFLHLVCTLYRYSDPDRGPPIRAWISIITCKY